MTWVASSPGHVHDRKAVPIAGWQRHAQGLPIVSLDDLGVFVLNAANVGEADVRHISDAVLSSTCHG
jgi:hypothetical protein